MDEPDRVHRWGTDDENSKSIDKTNPSKNEMEMQFVTGHLLCVALCLQIQMPLLFDRTITLCKRPKKKSAERGREF